MINTLLISLAIVAPQAHTPSATVSGNVVTVDADIAYIESTVEPEGASELLAGTQLAGDPSLAVSSDGSSPIQWRLPPGTYDITAYGFPDDRANPLRNVATLTVTIQEPDRIAQIRDALQSLTLAIYEAGVAQQKLTTLAPTRAEITQALGDSP